MMEANHQPSMPTGDVGQSPEHPSAPEAGPSEKPEAAASSSPPPAPPAKHAVSADMQAEIDEAMAALGFDTGEPKRGPRPGRNRGDRKQRDTRHADAPPLIGGEPPKPAIRGPRLVQAGREHRRGMVVSIGPTDIFIEFGPKELGVAPRTQWPDEQLPKVGQEAEVVVDRFESGENIFVCSRPGAVQKAEWEMLEQGQTVEARVTGTTKGGLELEVGGHRAFMPASQIDVERVPDLGVFVGEKLACRVAQVDRRGKGNIVLSRRDLLDEERKEKATKLKDTLKEGDTLEGRVRKVMPFGAFVDIGGVDGLVHISDLSYERVGFGEQAVARHVQEGQSVRVKVLKLDWDQNRISLGIKQTQSDPFASASEAIAEGAEVSGRVTRLTDFGAFVEVAPGVEGLVHVSEIAHRRINKPADELSQDQVVTCRVLKVDPQNRKISLSIRATMADPRAERQPRQPEAPTEVPKHIRKLREQKHGQELKGGFGKGFDDGGGLAGLKIKI